ncbi:hypothetical protein BC332_07080 [Capsicum chinense]|nr:hypothetical protein BC332_07080 [Capsicum chinense]
MFGDNAPTIEKDMREYMKSLFNEYSSSASKDKCGKLSSEVEASSSSSMVDIGDFYEELSRHTSGSGAENYLAKVGKEPTIDDILQLEQGFHTEFLFSGF